MGLAGQVRSVSVAAANTDVVWQQPSGPTLVLPIWCWECEFDTDGNQTKSGRTYEGSFHGEITRLVRNANGHVTERHLVDASTGETTRDEMVGPFGETETSSYLHGDLQFRTVINYDKYGHRIESLTLDAGGNQESHSTFSTDKDGNNLEQWDWGKNDQLLYHVLHTFDPKSKIEHLTTFNQFGGVNLTWTVIDGKLESFWEPLDAPSQYGDGFTEDVGNDTSENYDCHGDGICEVSRIHYEYLDPKHRNPISAEWRDAAGNLRYAAYYQYEIDAFRNWTHRQVWVWSPAFGERKLYETDSRSITYWPQ
jgi:hypothetical protein